MNGKGKITINYYGKEISMEFDEDITVCDFIDEAVAPMMIAMWYFPTNVYQELHLDEVLDVMKEALNRDS